MKLYDTSPIYTGVLMYEVDGVKYRRHAAININVLELKEEMQGIVDFYTNYFKQERGIEVDVSYEILMTLALRNNEIVKLRKPARYVD